MPVDPGSFAWWLRGLPLRPSGTPVLLHDGRPKASQTGHAAVVDIDTGKRDLQQCADAIMRLRAEWLFAMGRGDEIAFDYTNGARVPFSRWAAGERPLPQGRTVRWTPAARADRSHAALRAYLDQVFAYAGTWSLERELAPVPMAELSIGDVVIAGGFPGHALLVVDLVRHPTSGDTQFLLAQSYMPAQDVHVVRNPSAADGGAWYPLAFGERLVTPDWSFARESLRRWR